MNKIFLQSKKIGDWNRATYSFKPLKTGKSGETRVNYYFIPNPEAREMDIKAEIHRGKTFFTQKDGLLYGALDCLRKLGTIEKKEIY